MYIQINRQITNLSDVVELDEDYGEEDEGGGGDQHEHIAQIQESMIGLDGQIHRTLTRQPVEPSCL